jgi:hypothetical protein
MIKKVLAMIAPAATVAILTLVPNTAAARDEHKCPPGLGDKGSCVYVCPPGVTNHEDCVLYLCPPGTTDLDYCKRIGRGYHAHRPRHHGDS